MKQRLRNLKLAAFTDVTPEIWSRANAGDPSAVEIVKNTIYEVIYGVLKKYNASQWMDPAETESFVNNAWARITSEMPGRRENTTYSPIITKYDPNRGAAFSTFLFKAVTNLLWQYKRDVGREKKKLEEEYGQEVSLDAPIESQKGESNRFLSDMIEDPQSLTRFEDQEGAEEEFIMNMVRELGPALHIRDPRYMRYLYAYLKAGGDRQLSREIAFEDFGLQTYKDEIYNMMHNVVRPLVEQRFPDYAKMFKKTQEPVTLPQETSVVTPSLDVTPEEDAELDALVERGPREMESAPIRRIDPKTMQYVSSKLNLRKISNIQLTPKGQEIFNQAISNPRTGNLTYPSWVYDGIDEKELGAMELVYFSPQKSLADHRKHAQEFGIQIGEGFQDAISHGYLEIKEIPLEESFFNLPGNLPEGIASKLTFKKHAAEIPLQVWQDYRSTDPAIQSRAENYIFKALFNIIRAAVNRYDPQWMSSDDREDFIQKEATHFKTYSLDQYDPSKAKFETFVFNNVQNHLNSAFEQHKRSQKNIPTTSIHTPLGEEDSGELGDIIENPTGSNILEELSAAGMFEEIVARLQKMNASYPKILNAWMAADGDRNEASKLLASQGINLNPYTVYRVMTVIRDAIAKMFPEETSIFTMPRTEIPATQVIEDDASTQTTEAPAFRIVTDPDTGEERKVRISKVTGYSSRRQTWANVLLFWIKVSRK